MAQIAPKPPSVTSMGCCPSSASVHRSSRGTPAGWPKPSWQGLRVLKELRAQRLSHGIGGVPDRCYDHDRLGLLYINWLGVERNRALATHGQRSALALQRTMRQRIHRAEGADRS